MWYETSLVVLTAGWGEGCAELSAFDDALHAARIIDYNLIKISSVVPAGVPVEIAIDGPPLSGNGELIPAVFEFASSSEPGVTIAAGVAIGVPADGERPRPGTIFGYAGRCEVEKVEEILAEMVAEGMERKKYDHEYEIKIASTSFEVQSRTACAIASAVFCSPTNEAMFRSTLG